MQAVVDDREQLLAGRVIAPDPDRRDGAIPPIRVELVVQHSLAREVLPGKLGYGARADEHVLYYEGRLGRLPPRVLEEQHPDTAVWDQEADFMIESPPDRA